MLSECIELEEKLFNRRVTKFMKICGDVDSRELRQGMKIVFEFSSCLEKTRYCQKKLDCGHTATRKTKPKKIKKTPFKEAVEINNTQNVDTEHIDTSQNNILESSGNQDGTESEQELTDLAEILANLIMLIVIEQDLYSHGETSDTTNTC